MREIKFRAWNATTKEMLPDRDGDGRLFAILAIDSTFTYELMQFTGLKDKNGKEIYEGDIVRTALGVGQVVFKMGRFCIPHSFGIFDTEFLTDCEVIGNIYENPHLISGNTGTRP